MDKKAKIAMLSALFLVAVLVVGLVVAGPSKPCRDGIDNDGDGYIDYPADPGCSSKNDRDERNYNIECDDGSDNDGDSATDMNDNGCSSPSDNDETDCGDGVCEGGETSGTCPADCGTPDSCSDTDGGNVPLTFGTTSGYYNNNPYSNDDYCVDSSNIMEYYCSGDYEASSQQSCGTDAYGSEYCSAGDTIYKDLTDYFCSAGECDSDVTPEFVEDCDDSDGYGSNYCDADIVKKDYNNYFCTGGACDYTATPEQVEDCDDSDSYSANYCVGDIVKKDFNNSFCSGGACDSTTTPETVEDCDASDGYGSNYCVGDIVKKDYNNYFCTGGACDYTATPEQVEDCDSYDTYSSNYCQTGDVYRDFNNSFCSSGACDFTFTPELVEECDYGCTAGECDGAPDSCSDTDGGYYFYTLGTISGYDDSSPYSSQDYCLDSTILREYACSGVNPASYDHTCPNFPANGTYGCQNGVCA